MAVMATGGFSQLLSKDFEKIFFDNYRRNEKEWQRTAKVETGDGAYHREGELLGLTGFQPKGEGQPVPFEQFKQGPEKTVYYDEFGLGVQVTQVMYEDDQTGYMRQAMSELGKAASYTQDLRFWDLLNSGSTAGSTVGINGEILFSDTQPLLGEAGGTYSNVINGSLSKTTLEAAIDLFEGMVNENGIPIAMGPPYKLLIPYQLKWKAKELMLSQLDPESANNTINTVNDEGISYEIVHYLTDANTCFLVSNEHDLRHIWRRNVNFKSWDDPNTGNAVFKGDYRSQDTFYRWRGAIQISPA